MRKMKLGRTEVDQETFEIWLAEQGSSKYRATNYDLFRHNCNTFSNEASQFLGML